MALTFVAALGAAGLGMSSNANAGHGCGYGYEYGALTRATTVPGDTVRKSRTIAATTDSITTTVGIMATTAITVTADMDIMVTAVACISRLVSRRNRVDHCTTR